MHAYCVKVTLRKTDLLNDTSGVSNKEFPTLIIKSSKLAIERFIYYLNFVAFSIIENSNTLIFLPLTSLLKGGVIIRRRVEVLTVYFDRLNQISACSDRA